MKHVIAALVGVAALAAPAQADPDRVSILLGSYHGEATQRFNEVNPGLFLTWERGRLEYSVGAFVNSFNDPAVAGTVGYQLASWGDGALTAFGGLALYPDNAYISDHFQPIGGLQLRQDSMFMQLMPSDGVTADYIVTFGVTFDWE